jgi:hypothetical protein|tara:strand:- start:475 stop:1020 length:546 start_codon:yes stop_codon:yes gene_type:complete
MKITKVKLQQIVQEELSRAISENFDVVDKSTGEVMRFGDDARSAAPESALPSLFKRLGIEQDLEGAEGVELDADDFEKLSDEIEGKQLKRQAKKQRQDRDADDERLNHDNLKARLRAWADDAAAGWESDFAAGNQSVSIEDVAYDLAKSAEHFFKQDEWEEIMYAFDENEADVISYIASSM